MSDYPTTVDHFWRGIRRLTFSELSEIAQTILDCDSDDEIDMTKLTLADHLSSIAVDQEEGENLG